MNHNRAVVPIVGLGVVFVIAQGWIRTLWEKLYLAAHGTAEVGKSDPFSQSTNPFSPVTIGTGYDLALSSNGKIALSGTFHPDSKTFIANNGHTFQCDPSSTIGCIIPQSVLQQLGLA